MAGARLVTLYGRAGCSLCVKARAALAKLETPLRFAVEEVDIEADDALHEKYLLEIPVLAYEGRTLLAGRMNARSIEHALREAFGRGGG